MTRFAPASSPAAPSAHHAGPAGLQSVVSRRRHRGLLVALALAAVLAGCGGGGELTAAVTVAEPAGFQVGVVAGPVAYAPARPGQVLEVAGRVGERLAFDASEAVTWRFSVNGSPLFADGTTVDLGGITLTQTQVSPSRVVLDSAFDGPALVPVDVLLTATSTFDDAQVATIHLLLQ